ncbi:manganese efflux pump MntP family protein [Microbacterium sp. cx-55]|uniref:manganese efflux pump MntP n=1 Tax=Microbacterium sp. cx-55 TaxID=2875948 RepID=UPI001CBEEACF|nr:manganese efflux pump MntP family protein [Microbacterium sp. cx-55]MBZ4487872.1 manganese efflux pump MntP family protein [Microbacterium sp. cx-55]UGB34717.1 manganese efflux pump MntP family protein [Microbacterium sp. cx-55]
MSFFTLLVVSVGVSADAFAVSLSQGVRVTRHVYRDAFIVALTFGLFQALMPLLGFVLGAQFSTFIAPVDHWIAFGLLALIGGRMLWEAFRAHPDAAPNGRIRPRELVLLGVATSVDALAVGISFAFLDVDIVPAVALIGVITFAVSFLGVAIGHRVGTRFQKAAEIGGGIVLIGIGTKILLEHLLA